MAIEIAPGIVADPTIHHGSPVIRGTRIPAALILGQLASGMSADEVADEYGVTHGDIRAALGYASEFGRGPVSVNT
jgi:uncharacterized protein (DUF433 family)